MVFNFLKTEVLNKTLIFSRFLETISQTNSIQTFDFEAYYRGFCGIGSLDKQYCDAIENARNLVITYGTTEKEGMVWRSFRINNSTFNRITSKSEMPWNWTHSGPDITETNIFPKLELPFTSYVSGAFWPSKSVMAVVVVDDLFNQFQMFIRDLTEEGYWNDWKSTGREPYTGLFMLDKGMFAMTTITVYRFDPQMNLIYKVLVEILDKYLKHLIQLGRRQNILFMSKNTKDNCINDQQI